MGAWCEYNGKEFSMSGECNASLLSKYNIYNTDVSNPTAEFLAFAEILKIFPGINFRQSVVIVFHCDYVGMENWMSLKWSANKDYIQKIRDLCIMYIANISCKVIIKHVKAHSGNFGNGKADMLAGSLEHHNNFEELLRLLSE